MHDQYNPYSRNNENDIALLRLNRSVEFTEWIKPLCLPTASVLRDRSYGNETTFVVAGYGRVSVSNFYSIEKKNIPFEYFRFHWNLSLTVSFSLSLFRLRWTKFSLVYFFHLSTDVLSKLKLIFFLFQDGKWFAFIFFCLEILFKEWISTEKKTHFGSTNRLFLDQFETLNFINQKHFVSFIIFLAQFSNLKLKVELNAVPINQCIQKYRSKGILLTENQLCAGGEKGKDACKGLDLNLLASLHTANLLAHSEYSADICNFLWK